jgi:protein O-mannosyl-transferase
MVGTVPSASPGSDQPVGAPVPESRPHSTAKWNIFLGLLLVLATASLYFPVHNYEFVYDDYLYVIDNGHINHGLDWKALKWALTANYADNWHPLTWLSHGLDCQLFFLNSGWHHVTNVLLHAINAVLLFWVLLRATGSTSRSFMVAALFTLHPINVESVAWISERKNLLSMLFFLLALAAYRWYAREPRVGRYATVASLFALGLMAKPQIITLPLVLLLWDYWPLRRMFADGDSAASDTGVIPARSLSWLVLEKLPLLVLVGASAVITLHAQRLAATPYPLSVRFANALVSYVWYVKKAFWPSHLALLYPHPPGLPPIWQMAAAVLFLLAVTALVLARRRQRYLLVGWLWFLGTLVPMIGLVQVGRQAMADRYAYLPFVGLFIMVCWGAAEWSEQMHLRPAWLGAASLVVLFALALDAQPQIRYWRNNYILWSRSLQVTSPNKEAEDNLGVVLMQDDRLDEALPHLQTAVALDPLSSGYNLNLAICEQRLGNLTEAIKDYQVVIKVTQNDIPGDKEVRYHAFNNMSSVYLHLGDLPHAQESHEEAQKLLREYGTK